MESHKSSTGRQRKPMIQNAVQLTKREISNGKKWQNK